MDKNKKNKSILIKEIKEIHSIYRKLYKKLKFLVIDMKQNSENFSFENQETRYFFIQLKKTFWIHALGLQKLISSKNSDIQEFIYKKNILEIYKNKNNSKHFKEFFLKKESFLYFLKICLDVVFSNIKQESGNNWKENLDFDKNKWIFKKLSLNFDDNDFYRDSIYFCENFYFKNKKKFAINFKNENKNYIFLLKEYSGSKQNIFKNRYFTFLSVLFFDEKNSYNKKINFQKIYNFYANLQNKEIKGIKN